MSGSVSTIFNYSSQQAVTNFLAVLREDPISMPAGVDLLVTNYMALHREDEEKIQAALQSHGYVDDAVRDVLQQIGPAASMLSSLELNIASGDWARRIQQLSAAFPMLKRFNVSSCQLEPTNLTLIGCSFEQLEELNLNDNYCVRWERGAAVDGIDVRAASFQNLRVLSWNNSKVRDQDLASMPLMPRLERLSIQGGGSHDNDFQAPLRYIQAAAPNLTHLDLGNSPSLTLAALAGIERLQHLNTLSIVGCPSITAAELVAFRAQHPRLTIQA